MPDRLERFQQSGDLHFLTFSCHDRLSHLNSDEARDCFERSLETVRRQYMFFILGYVIMPEHAHLLVSEPRRSTLATALQALKTSVAKQSKERPFWLPRYYDFNVYSRAKHIEKLRYIHRNPVMRGLVAEPEDWRWSSFRHYLLGEVGTVEIESTWTAGRRLGLKLPAQFELAIPP